MKKLLLFVTLSAGFTFAQVQFENASFENWEELGTPNEEPLEWSSLKTGTGPAWGAAVVCSRSTDAHSGTYSVRLENKSSFGVVNNGLLTNGRVAADFDPENGYVFTDAADTDWNLACTDRPDSLVGWYKYTPVGTDKGKVEVLLHDNTAEGKLPETTAPAAHWIGKARFDITTASAVWVRFSVPFHYYTSGTPNFILAVCSAGDSTVAVEGSVLLLDDLELIYNPAPTVDIAPTADQFIDISTDGTVLTATEAPSAAISREWKYTTTSGSGYTGFAVAETGITYTPNFDTPGTYFVVCESDFGTDIITSNEVTIFVNDPSANNVTVSPAGAQTILLSEDGTLLTATETPAAADSREWKVSTTAGSGHVSFTTPETGVTYMPNFDVLGTYYVVCESDFAGEIKTSNEIIINVPSAAGIETDELTFKIVNINGALQISLNQFQGARFALYNLAGQTIYQRILSEEVSYHHMDNLSGVYVYNIFLHGQVISGKINF